MSIKKFDDRPMYEQNKPREETGYTAAPKYKDFAPTDMRGYKTSAPSPLYVWWHEEKKKQNLGLMNEHDINEIKAAHTGVINRWRQCYLKNKDAIDKMIEFGKFDWNKLMEFKNAQ